MRLDKDVIWKLLPDKFRKQCLVGICNPLYLERKKRVLCYVPIEYGGRRWSAKPSEILPFTTSIIALIYFTTIAQDYSVEDIILTIAGRLWRKLKIKTHVLNKFGRPCKKNIVGCENSFLETSSYDAGKKMILLKDIAYYAGLGQYGRNSLIINNRFGSDIKIQALFTGARLEYDKPILPKAYAGCRSCKICIEVCPAKAISNYKVISQHNICRLIVRDKATIVGRFPKKAKVWDSGLIEQKIACRACQSFCPANSPHYVKNSLVIAKKERKGGIRLFLTRGF